jgi:hypothetical protein
MRSGSLKVRLDGPPLNEVRMDTAVSRSIPPQPLINMVNPVVRRILRSPLHSVLDRALLVLHVVGSKSGHLYDMVIG